MTNSYYKTIQGVRYDRALLEVAEERISGQGDGRISLNDAEEIFNLSKDGGRITETELRTLKYISDNYHFTSKAAEWFTGILNDTEQAVDFEHFEKTQLRTQKQQELDKASSPIPEQDLSTLTTPQSEEFTLEVKPTFGIPHLIWGALLFIAILVGIFFYQGAIKGIDTLEFKLSASPRSLELEQQISDIQSERSALQKLVSELKQKVVVNNIYHEQLQKNLRAEQDRLTPEISKITNQLSEVQVIGVFDFIISRTDFKIVKCEAYSCNFVSTDNVIKIDLKQATLEQHVSENLKSILDIEFDSRLFKSGLIVHYYNDKNLIRVYLKGSDISIKVTRKDEIENLQAWLQKIMMS